MTSITLQKIQQASKKVCECAETARLNMEMREYMESRMRDWFDVLETLMLEE